MVVVTTIFPRGPLSPDRWLQWSPQIDQAVEEVNADLRSLRTSRVLVFEAWSILQQHGRMPAEYSVETVHVNDRGNAMLNGQLVPLLRTAASVDPDPLINFGNNWNAAIRVRHRYNW